MEGSREVQVWLTGAGRGMMEALGEKLEREVGARVPVEPDVSQAADRCGEADLLLVNAWGHGREVFEELQSCAAARPRTGILVFGPVQSRAAAARLLETGDAAFVATDDGVAGLVRVVVAIVRGRGTPRGALGGVVRELRRRLDGATAPEPWRQLTPRELDVLQGVVAGEHNREIARDLGISPLTVKRHLHSVFRKLGVHSRLAAVVAAIQMGLLDDIRAL